MSNRKPFDGDYLKKLTGHSGRPSSRFDKPEKNSPKSQGLQRQFNIAKYLDYTDTESERENSTRGWPKDTNGQLETIFYHLKKLPSASLRKYWVSTSSDFPCSASSPSVSSPSASTKSTPCPPSTRKPNEATEGYSKRSKGQHTRPPWIYHDQVRLDFKDEEDDREIPRVCMPSDLNEQLDYIYNPRKVVTPLPHRRSLVSTPPGSNKFTPSLPTTEVPKETLKDSLGIVASPKSALLLKPPRKNTSFLRSPKSTYYPDKQKERGQSRYDQSSNHSRPVLEVLKHTSVDKGKSLRVDSAPPKISDIKITPRTPPKIPDSKITPLNISNVKITLPTSHKTPQTPPQPILKTPQTGVKLPKPSTKPEIKFDPPTSKQTGHRGSPPSRPPKPESLKEPAYDEKLPPLWSTTMRFTPDFAGFIPYVPSDKLDAPTLATTASGTEIYVGMYSDLRERVKLLHETLDFEDRELRRTHQRYSTFAKDSEQSQRPSMLSDLETLSKKVKNRLDKYM